MKITTEIQPQIIVRFSVDDGSDFQWSSALVLKQAEWDAMTQDEMEAQCLAKAKEWKAQRNASVIEELPEAKQSRLASMKADVAALEAEMVK